jgi:hypothetical protein
MKRLGPDLGALGEAVVFLDYFKDMPDPRQRGKVIYRLDEVLLLCLLAVLAGAETFVDIARFGEKKLDLLRRFRKFPHGTPSHDHLGDIFATLDAAQFQRCFVAWVAALTGASAEVIAIDGKTLRRSARQKPSGKALSLRHFLEGSKHRVEAEFIELRDEPVGFDIGGSPVEVVTSEIVVFNAVLEHVVDGGEHGGGYSTDGLLRATPTSQAVELGFIIAVLLLDG